MDPSDIELDRIFLSTVHLCFVIIITQVLKNVTVRILFKVDRFSQHVYCSEYVLYLF